MAGYDHHFSGTLQTPPGHFFLNLCSKGIGTVPDTGDNWGNGVA